MKQNQNYNTLFIIFYVGSTNDKEFNQFTLSGCNKVGFCHSRLYSNIYVVFPLLITTIALKCLILKRIKN